MGGSDRNRATQVRPRAKTSTSTVPPTGANASNDGIGVVSSKISIDATISSNPAPAAASDTAGGRCSISKPASAPASNSQTRVGAR